MTDELDNETIKGSFVSGGPKNYSFTYGNNKQKRSSKVFDLTMKILKYLITQI